MQCIKTYEYHYSEDELRQMIVDYFNAANKEHLPITKNNVRIDFDRNPYCDPTPKVVITIEEGV